MKMKKFLSVILATLVLSCSTACGTSVNSDTSSTNEVSSSAEELTAYSETEDSKVEESKADESQEEIESEEEESEAESESEEEGEQSRQYKNIETLEEYINLSSVQDTIKEMQEQYADTALIDLVAEGNKLVYSFKLNEQLDAESVSIFSSTIDAQMDSLDSVYTSIAASINDMFGRDDTIVVVRYSNADGSVVWEKEFTES